MTITAKLVKMSRDVTMTTGRCPTRIRVGSEIAKTLAEEGAELMTLPHLNRRPMASDVLAQMKAGQMTILGMAVEVLDSGLGYCRPGPRAMFDPSLLEVV